MLARRLHSYGLASLAQEGTRQAMERETWTSTQPQNPRPTICPFSKMSWGNGSAELVGVSHSYERNSMTDTAWMANRIVHIRSNNAKSSQG